MDKVQVPVGSVRSFLNPNDPRKPGGGVRRIGNGKSESSSVTEYSVVTQAGLAQSLAPTSRALMLLQNHKASAGAVKSSVGFDKSRNFRAQVERAIREHKIYSCSGVYPAVRKALQGRGWVEKCPSLGLAKSTKELEFGSDNETDEAWLSRVLKDYPADFTWVLQRNSIEWRNLHKDQIINRFPKPFFTTKVGIAACLQNIQWFRESGVADTSFPRCYRLCTEEERTAFVDDYRLTACTSLLKWLVTNYEQHGESGVTDPSSRVVSVCVDFAIRQVNNYLRERRHEDIDWLLPPSVMGQIWDIFLTQYNHVVCLKSKLAPADHQDCFKLKYEASKRALSRIGTLLPQHMEIDGVNNIWIVKPSARSRGQGIVILNKLDKILDLLNQANARELNWVVQKYIERPLLVFKTKFDIRQWFLVSDFQPLTLWFYKESYIRFCTKQFSLEDFHESLHLCNNAIQCRYQNAETRDPTLPQDNMWDNHAFTSFLSAQGHPPDLWDRLIYPGMKQGILGVLLASQESNEIRKNCFELYGADFMLSENCKPWLIEINSCPSMAATSKVTSRMCAECLTDAVKVILDHKKDPNADTGLFELIYKEKLTEKPAPFVNTQSHQPMTIQGKKILGPAVHCSTVTANLDSKCPTSISSKPQAPSALSNSDSSSKDDLTFSDLVHRLRRNEARPTEFPEDQLPTYCAPPILIPGRGNSKTSHGRPRSSSRSRSRSRSKQKLKNVQETADGSKSETETHNQKPLIHKSDEDSGSSPNKTRRNQNENKPSKVSPKSNSSTKNSKDQVGTLVADESNSTSLSSLLLINSIKNQPTIADLIRVTNRKSSGNPADTNQENVKNAQDETSPPENQDSKNPNVMINANNNGSDAVTKTRPKGTSSKTNRKIRSNVKKEGSQSTLNKN